MTLSAGYDTWNDIDVWLVNLMPSNVGITTHSQAIRSSKVNKSMLEVNKLYKNNLQCLYYAYSSADSWKPPIHVSDWLIFWNLRLYQKKK